MQAARKSTAEQAQTVGSKILGVFSEQMDAAHGTLVLLRVRGIHKTGSGVILELLSQGRMEE